MYNLLDTLRGKITGHDNYVEVTSLEEGLCEDIMRSLLLAHNRDLNANQWQIVREAFTKCSLPIFVYLTYHQVSVGMLQNNVYVCGL